MVEGNYARDAAVLAEFPLWLKSADLGGHFQNFSVRVFYFVQYFGALRISALDAHEDRVPFGIGAGVRQNGPNLVWCGVESGFDVKGLSGEQGACADKAVGALVKGKP